MRPRQALFVPVVAVLMACGTNVDLGGSPAVTDAGGDAPADVCAGYAAPDTPAGCYACSGTGCQANGCYGGYYCKIAIHDCQSPSTACLAADAGYDAWYEAGYDASFGD